MSNRCAMSIAFCIAIIMFICLAAPYYQNKMKQGEADKQIASGTVSNMTAETNDKSGKFETVYTIYICGSYIYDGEEQIGERSLNVPLEFFMRYEIGDYVTEEEIKSVLDLSNTLETNFHQIFFLNNNAD